MPGDLSPLGTDPGRVPPPALRASHADRDRVVEVLRVAAGDGRLTAEELDERLDAALAARTLGELAELTSDLPPVSAFGGGAVAEVRDVLRIDQKYSPVERVGRWVVPRQLELVTEFCEVTLDFTQAVITHDTLRIDMEMQGKTLTLITRPGIVVDTDALNLAFSKIKVRHVPAAGEPVLLRVELAGNKSYGRVVVRRRGRSLGGRLLGRAARR
ncbi:DUF1707 SHOCT-like domain-containing protein [Streptacidiphilus monticola]|uniref:DUF1707 domain-containing protein n=1 Tax=Streptacidiphilus monticola TaxID=2161674 RepID=A0ABW1FX89_9ACTN